VIVPAALAVILLIMSLNPPWLAAPQWMERDRAGLPS
jgi:hypothetical protein